MSILSKLQALLTAANTKTGESDTTLTDAVQTLVDGYGQGGGGGVTTVASGTVVGSNNTDAAGLQIINIGTKMAQTNFYILISAQNDTEIEFSSSMRKIVWAYASCLDLFGRYDLSSNGEKSFTSNNYHIDSNNEGVITERPCADLVFYGKQIYNGAVAHYGPNTLKIIKTDDHFELRLGTANATTYIFPEEITYNYEVVYFGSTPATDIIEIS